MDASVLEQRAQKLRSTIESQRASSRLAPP
jgi:hypothetical protein